MVRVCGLLLACTALLAACSDDDGGDAPGTTLTTSTSAPETTAPVMVPEGATERGLRELEVGECFDPVDDPIATDRAVWLIECSGPHSHEVYDVVPYEGEGAEGGEPYPGVAVVQDWSEQACYDRFEGFVGIRWTLSELDIQVWWPSEESWELGDRSVVCTVFSPTGDRLEGSQRGVSR